VTHRPVDIASNVSNMENEDDLTVMQMRQSPPKHTITIGNITGNVTLNFNAPRFDEIRPALKSQGGVRSYVHHKRLPSDRALNFLTPS
jgi:hypothetical protein